MTDRTPVSPDPAEPLVDQLGRAFDVVGALIARVRPDQWDAPTPCSEWDVGRLVTHLIGMNRVFTSLLLEQPPPPRETADHADGDLLDAYRETAVDLLRVFARPGVLDHEYAGPLGTASGADRLQIRLYDLLAHGWDLAQATGHPVDLPEDLAEQSLRFARTQLADSSRAGRFSAATVVPPDAPAIERLVAFLGRTIPSVSTRRPTA